MNHEKILTFQESTARDSLIKPDNHGKKFKNLLIFCKIVTYLCNFLAKKKSYISKVSCERILHFLAKKKKVIDLI